MSKTSTKKGRQPKEEPNEEQTFKGNKNPNQSFFSDIMHHTGDTDYLRWGDIYKYFKEQEYPKLKVREYEGCVDQPSDEEDYEDYANIKRSCLHQISTKPGNIPYYDPMKWIFDHIDLDTHIVLNEEGFTIASFKGENLN